MTEETMPAAAPAEQHTQPAQQTPATHHEEQYQPAHESSPADYEDTEEHEEPADLGEILEDARPKKLSGAQRAKLQREYLQNELRQREQHIEERDRRIAELEGHISAEDDRRRSAEAERQAEAQRKRDEAHVERVKGAKGTIADFDIVMRSMEGKLIHEDLLEDVLSSDKSDLLAYHLAKNPNKLDELNRMPVRERVREIGRLEATLKLPEGKKMTSAPPPPSRLSGGAAPHVSLEQEGDMGTFAKRLIKTLDARKRQ